MNQLIRWCGALLLIVPILANADPVRLDVSANGTMTLNPEWLDKFTNEPGHVDGARPYAVTLNAEFDPDSPDFQSATFGTLERVYQANPESVFTFTVDGKTYTIEGGLSLSASMEPDRYHIELWFTDLSTDFLMILTFIDPDGGFDGDPLTPRALSAGGSMRAAFLGLAFNSNPDSSAQWSAGGPASTASLSVSSIPEPSHAGMLATGLLVLSIALRKRAT